MQIETRVRYWMNVVRILVAANVVLLGGLAMESKASAEADETIIVQGCAAGSNRSPVSTGSGEADFECVCNSGYVEDTFGDCVLAEPPSIGDGGIVTPPTPPTPPSTPPPPCTDHCAAAYLNCRDEAEKTEENCLDAKTELMEQLCGQTPGSTGGQMRNGLSFGAGDQCWTMSGWYKKTKRNVCTPEEFPCPFTDMGWSDCEAVCERSWMEGYGGSKYSIQIKPPTLKCGLSGCSFGDIVGMVKSTVDVSADSYNAYCEGKKKAHEYACESEHDKCVDDAGEGGVPLCPVPEEEG